MKVLHVIPSFAPAWRYGGPIVAALEMTKALVRLGHDVTVFTTNIDGSDDLDVPTDRPVELDGVQVRYFPVKRPRSYCYSPDISRALERQVSDFDIVHIHSIFLWPTTVAASWCRRKNVPYIIRPAGMLSDEMMTKSYVDGARSAISKVKKWSYMRTFGKSDLASAAAFHFTSESEMAASRAMEPNADSFVIPLGVDAPDPSHFDPSYLRNRLPDIGDNPIVLFLSRIDPKKGLDVLIESLALLGDHHRFAFVVAGSGTPAYERTIKELVVQRGLDNRTHFLGLVEGDEKWAVLHGANLFVLPSHNENFGVAVVEAMASGLPIVISDQVAIHKIVGGANAGIVTRVDATEVAAAIEALLNDPAMSRAMGENGAALASKEYSREICGNRIAEMYESILRKSGRAQLTTAVVDAGA